MGKTYIFLPNGHYISQPYHDFDLSEPQVRLRPCTCFGSIASVSQQLRTEKWRWNLSFLKNICDSLHTLRPLSLVALWVDPVFVSWAKPGFPRNCFEKIFLTTFRGKGWPIPLSWHEHIEAWEAFCGTVASFRVNCSLVVKSLLRQQNFKTAVGPIPTRPWWYSFRVKMDPTNDLGVSRANDDYFIFAFEHSTEVSSLQKACDHMWPPTNGPELARNNITCLQNSWKPRQANRQQHGHQFFGLLENFCLCFSDKRHISHGLLFWTFRRWGWYLKKGTWNHPVQWYFNATCLIISWSQELEKALGSELQDHFGWTLQFLWCGSLWVTDFLWHTQLVRCCQGIPYQAMKAFLVTCPKDMESRSPVLNQWTIGDSEIRTHQRWLRRNRQVLVSWLFRRLKQAHLEATGLGCRFKLTLSNWSVFGKFQTSLLWFENVWKTPYGSFWKTPNLGRCFVSIHAFRFRCAIDHSFRGRWNHQLDLFGAHVQWRDKCQNLLARKSILMIHTGFQTLCTTISLIVSPSHDCTNHRYSFHHKLCVSHFQDQSYASNSWVVVPLSPVLWYVRLNSRYGCGSQKMNTSQDCCWCLGRCYSDVQMRVVECETQKIARIFPSRCLKKKNINFEYPKCGW